MAARSTIRRGGQTARPAATRTAAARTAATPARGVGGGDAGFEADLWLEAHGYDADGQAFTERASHGDAEDAADGDGTLAGLAGLFAGTPISATLATGIFPRRANANRERPRAISPDAWFDPFAASECALENLAGIYRRVLETVNLADTALGIYRGRLGDEWPRVDVLDDLRQMRSRTIEIIGELHLWESRLTYLIEKGETLREAAALTVNADAAPPSATPPSPKRAARAARKPKPTTTPAMPDAPITTESTLPAAREA